MSTADPIRINLEGGAGDGTTTDIPHPPPLLRWDDGVITPVETDDGMGYTYELVTDDQGRPMRDVFGRQRYWLVLPPVTETRFDR